MTDHEGWMKRALALADRAAADGEVPVGAVLVADGGEIARGWNRSVGDCDPTAHAEIIALREAARKLNNYRLPGTTLYVTVEPCTMCAGALVHARIARLVFGVREPKGGAVRTRVTADGTTPIAGLNHRFEVIEGVLEADCRRRLEAFFAARRSGRSAGPVQTGTGGSP